MLRFIVVGLLIASPVYAWDNTTSGHGPQSIADGGPSQAQQATGGNATANGGAGGHGGRGGSSTVTNTITPASGSGWSGQQFPVSSAIAPSVYGGICVGQGASLAGSTPVFGISAGGNQVDRVCQLHMIGQDAVAREYLCRADKDVRAAFLASGQPCAADHVVPVAAVVANPAPAFTPSPWCAHASSAQRRANAASCG